MAVRGLSAPHAALVRRLIVEPERTMENFRRFMQCAFDFMQIPGVLGWGIEGGSRVGGFLQAA